jgi:excisionase family DNA binding protein
MTEPRPDPLLDVQEAAAYLGGVSRRTVYREVERGRLHPAKVGGLTRFLQSELDRYIRASMRNRVA